MAKRTYWTVSFEVPEGAKINDCRFYIADAIQSWRGSLRPPGGHGPDDQGDPMFGLNPNTVKITAFHNKKKEAK